jgi:hypothetical protein
LNGSDFKPNNLPCLADKVNEAKKYNFSTPFGDADLEDDDDILLPSGKVIFSVHSSNQTKPFDSVSQQKPQVGQVIFSASKPAEHQVIFSKVSDSKVKITAAPRETEQRTSFSSTAPKDVDQKVIFSSSTFKASEPKDVEQKVIFSSSTFKASEPKPIFSPHQQANIGGVIVGNSNPTIEKVNKLPNAESSTDLSESYDNHQVSLFGQPIRLKKIRSLDESAIELLEFESNYTGPRIDLQTGLTISFVKDTLVPFFKSGGQLDRKSAYSVSMIAIIQS